MSASRAVARVARKLAGTATVTLVFVVALVAGVLLHLGTAPARRMVARVLPAALVVKRPGAGNQRLQGAFADPQAPQFCGRAAGEQRGETQEQQQAEGGRFAALRQSVAFRRLMQRASAAALQHRRRSGTT